MTSSRHASASVIRHKKMKNRIREKANAERRRIRKTRAQQESILKSYNRINHSVFKENESLNRIRSNLDLLTKKNPTYNDTQAIKALNRWVNSHETTTFKGSRNVFRSAIKSVYDHEHARNGNLWKKELQEKDIPTPKTVAGVRKFWSAYHKLNDLLESQHGSKDIFSSEYKLTYLTGHVAGQSEDIAQSTFEDLLQYAEPTTDIIL